MFRQVRAGDTPGAARADGSPSLPPNLRWHTPLAVLVVALAAFLRFHGLADQPLWLDEGYSWWDAQQSLPDLWALVPQCDPHPPLYFVLLKGWVWLFGDDRIVLRALSALLGVGTTVVLIGAGRLLAPAAGLVAGLMFALTPFQVEFAHEARPYSLLCFGAALVAYGALRLMSDLDLASPVGAGRDAPSSGLAQRLAAFRGHASAGGLVALGVGTVVVLWSNNTSVLIVAATCLVVALVFAVDAASRPRLRAATVVLVLAGALWLPYLPVLLEQAKGVSSDFWIPRPTEFWRVINELRFVVSLSVYEAFWWGFGLAALGVALLWRRRRWREALALACLAVVPALLNYLISLSIKPIFISRALMGVAPPVILAVACAVTLLRRPWLRATGITLVVGAHVVALVHESSVYQGKEPWDRIARAVASPAPSAPAAPPAGSTQALTPGMAAVLAVADARSGATAGAATQASGSAAPIVLVAANELALPLSHALKEIDARVPLKGAPTDFPAPGLHARYPSGKCAPSVRGQDLGAIARAIKGHGVVWFITRRNNVYDPDNGIVKFLARQGLKQVEVRRFMPGFLEVYKFVGSAPGRDPRAAAGGQRAPRPAERVPAALAGRTAPGFAHPALPAAEVPPLY